MQKKTDTNAQKRCALRDSLRAARASLPKACVKTHSARICEKLADILREAQYRHIAGYYAFGNETNLQALMDGFTQMDKTGYVPVVLPEYRMRFAPVDANTPTTRNRYGIKEPQIDKAALVAASSLDAILLPLVGFDEHCNRMGMGGGYYDRCFAHRANTQGPPLLIGVAFETQCVDEVYVEAWDVQLDYVVTEARVLQRKNNE